MYKVYHGYQAFALCPRERHVMPLMQRDIEANQQGTRRDKKDSGYQVGLGCY